MKKIKEKKEKIDIDNDKYEDDKIINNIEIEKKKEDEIVTKLNDNNWYELLLKSYYFII